MTENYLLYGVIVRSSYPFGFHYMRTGEPEDLTFEYRGVKRDYSPEGAEYVPPYHDGMGIRVYISRGKETLLYPGIAAFECSDSLITAYLLKKEFEYLIDICFAGSVMSYWLERRGTVTLHASSIRAGKGAVAFLAEPGGGKTTVAAAFAASGYPLVTDDILPVRMNDGSITAYPGFPQMKLLEDQLKLFGETPDNFEKVHPLYNKRKVPIGCGLGMFEESPLPLIALYILDRDDGRMTAPVSSVITPSESLIYLLKNSFTAQILDPIDMNHSRIERLAGIGKNISMKKLIVPRGYEYLPDLIDHVLGEVL